MSHRVRVSGWPKTSRISTPSSPGLHTNPPFGDIPRSFRRITRTGAKFATDSTNQTAPDHVYTDLSVTRILPNVVGRVGNAGLKST